MPRHRVIAAQRGNVCPVDGSMPAQRPIRAWLRVRDLAPGARHLDVQQLDGEQSTPREDAAALLTLVEMLECQCGQLHFGASCSSCGCSFDETRGRRQL